MFCSAFGELPLQNNIPDATNIYMAKKKTANSPNMTVRISDADRELFEEAARIEHFDSLSQWIKVHLRRIASEVVLKVDKK
jgi:hypothetical protein